MTSLKTMSKTKAPRGASGGDERALKAWTVEIDGTACVTFNHTRAKATMGVVLSYWDAYGRRKGTFPKTSTHREKCYDDSPCRLQPGRAWDEEHVMKSLHMI